jgi:DNA (cytosine-5)-methyltransferase 1
MENVPQVVCKANFKDFREWEIFLEGLGYSNYYQLLNAKDYGIPQNRNRCFMVSILGNFYYQFPCKKKLVLRLKDLLEDNVDEKYYLSEKALNGLKNTQFQCSKIENRVAKGGIIPTILARDYKDPKLVLVAQLNGFESSGRIYSEDGLAPTINTMGGGNREPKIATRLAKTLEKNSIEDGDFIDSYNQIIRKGISGTITTRVSESNNTFVACTEPGKVYSNLCVRKLTPKECWRLMGFSDEDFEKASKVNSNSQLYKQAGNSIVVNVLEEIFKMLF